MKIFKFTTILLISLLIGAINYCELKAQKPDEGFNYEEAPKLKYIFLDLGYGNYGASVGAGFRYSFFGASFNLTGFSKTIPSYSTDWITRPTKEEQIGYRESFPTIILTLDGGLYYDIDETWTIFGTIGYFTQSDSMLVKKNGTNGQPEETWYPWKAETSSGFTFGGGVQYFFFEESIAVGLGYQTKKGAYAQIGYYW
jgi:opacity protein-like surface antigen